MGEAYGIPPDKMLNADLTQTERFWFRNDVWAATRLYEQRVKESKGNGRPSSESTQMAAEQEQRADLDQAAPEEQLQRLEEIRQMGDE